MNQNDKSFNQQSNAENKNFSSGDKNKNEAIDVQKQKEENKNSPDNFGSLRHQKGAVDENQDPEANVPEEDNDLAGAEYRDPPAPGAKAKHLE